MLFIANLTWSNDFSGKAPNVAVKVTIVVDVNNQVPQTTLGNWSGAVAQWSDGQAISEKQLFVEGGWYMLA